MEPVLIIVLVVGGAFLFLAFGTNFGRDPSTKTLPQLRLAEKLHAKRVRHTYDSVGPGHPKYAEALAEWQRVTEEIKKREAMLPMTENAVALLNAVAKLRGNVKMFRNGITARRLQRGADADDLHYYIGYITALARAIAAKDGVAADGTILAPVQMEASRLLGTSITENGDYSEGMGILPGLLANGTKHVRLRGPDVFSPDNLAFCPSGGVLDRREITRGMIREFKTERSMLWFDFKQQRHFVDVDLFVTLTYLAEKFSLRGAHDIEPPMRVAYRDI